MEKYCTAGQDTDDNMAHAHCMLGYIGLKIHANLEYVILYSFSTAIIVTRTRYVICILHVLFHSFYHFGESLVSYFDISLIFNSSKTKTNLHCV